MAGTRSDMANNYSVVAGRLASWLTVLSSSRHFYLVQSPATAITFQSSSLPMMKAYFDIFPATGKCVFPFLCVRMHPEEYQMQWTGILKIRFIYLFVFHSRQKKGNRKRGKWTQTRHRHRNLILLHFSHLIMRLVLSVVVWALLNNVCIVVFISKLRKTIYYSPNPLTYYYSQWHKHWWLTNMKLFAVKNAFVCIQFPADEKTHTQNLTRTMTRWEMGVL